VTGQHHIYLVPGLFGFESLGELRYMAHVHDRLAAELEKYELDVEIHQARTPPTASIRTRAAKLLETICDGPARDAGQLHLIGHSTGGLDARLLATPNVSLRTEQDPAEIAGRIRKVVTIATPHYGTPLAPFLASVHGRQLLRLLLLMTIHVLDAGQLPIAPLLELGPSLVGLDHGVGIEEQSFDRIYDQLLDGLRDELRDQAQELTDEASSDQALFDQLTPAGIDVFNAATTDRDSVRYGSVICAAKQPGLKSVSAAGLDSYIEASNGLFAALHRITASGTSESYRGPLTGEQAERLQNAYGTTPSARDNDGVVPTHSQLWGEVIHATRCDHLDVIGHFDDPSAAPPHFDWLASGSGFDRAGFEELWAEVARFIAEDEGEAA
jgi:hypothetical protein